MHKIGVLPGDGIGPEVVAQGLRVLERLAAMHGFAYELVHLPYGAEHYLKTGELLPDEAIAAMRGLDAIYLGALGDPRIPPGIIERGVLLRLRFELDLYVNLRPIVLYAEHLCPVKDKRPEDVDLVVVRENTEDAYAGLGGFLKQGTRNEVAISEMIYTRDGVERVMRFAFDLARQRNKQRKVTLVDKANAIRAHDLWQRVFAEVGSAYPDIAREHAYVDAAAMWLIKNPEWFDVIVTTNIFGDILTDIGAIVQGGLGIAASGNIHPGRVSMFEPIHGSAPKYAGKNVANPLAAIAAVGMLLDYVGQGQAADHLQRSVRRLLESKRIPSLGTDSGLTTSQIGDLVLSTLEEGR